MKTQVYHPVAGLRPFVLTYAPHVFVLFLMVFAFQVAWSHDIYTLVGKRCRAERGQIIDVHDGEVALLDLEGRYRQIPTSEIEMVILHSVLENPMTKILNDQRSAGRLKAVYTQNRKSPTLIGWPVKFIEELVVFYDLQGKSHVLDLYKITKIRPAPGTLVKGLQVESKKANLGIDNTVSTCPNIQSKGLRPTRILADKIRISDFLSTYEKGFDRLSSYEERTYFYAKPLLYSLDTKLGFLFYGTLHEIPKLYSPIYFRWGSGLPYRYQSSNQVGGGVTTIGPSMEPGTYWQSEFKSHLFHAAFVGNLSALSAGTEYYTSMVSSTGGFADIDPNNITLANHSRSGASFNYMALLGVDYLAYSFSFGTGYMIHYLEVGDQFREILGSKPSLLFRAMYTLPKIQLRAILSTSNYDAGSDISDLQLSYSSKDSVVGTFNGFNFASQFWRFGGDWQATEDLTLGGDIILTSGNYSEQLLSGENNLINFQNQTLSAHIRHGFGDYVSLGVFMNWQNNSQDYSFMGVSNSHRQNYMETGGSFEFLF